MKLNGLLLAVPVMFTLSACSCGNKIKNDASDEDSVSAVDVSVVSESNFFNGKTSDRVFFATDKSSLNHESQATLTEQANLLKGRHDVDVVVEGHCDERGTREYNLALGERRANAAKEFLAKHGVHNVGTVSFGKEQPAVMGHDAEAWAQNRRAVTVVNKK